LKQKEKTMPGFKLPTRKATTLDDAWINFDPQTPLPNQHPFYVAPPENPLDELIWSLRKQVGRAPKCFFAGHRGCGKSTELLRLIAHAGINMDYWPVHFSVRDKCDPNDLDYVEVLLALAAQIYLDFTAGGGKLDSGILAELESWKNRTIEKLTAKGAVFETGVGFDLGKFFLTALTKVQTEHATRQIVREEFRPRVSELIARINLIAAQIQAATKRNVLVVIEDLDKIPLEQARTLFADNYQVLIQPALTIVYTVPIALYFSPAYTSIREQGFFLPNVNVKVHARIDRDKRNETGYEIMRRVAHNRMDESLIAPQALDEAVRLSGGIFRELTHVMQTAIARAALRQAERVTIEDVREAESRIRNSFRRILTADDRAVLREVWASRELRDPERLSPLLHLLAVIEYKNDENWCDVHPALEPLLREESHQT
jgi:hypothetical protein